MGGAFRDQSRYSSRYATAGMQGMIVTWVEDGMRMPAGEMAQMIERMMGSSQPQAASVPIKIASAKESPSDTQPGRSGTTTVQPSFS